MIEIDSEIDSERNRNVQSKGIKASYLPFRVGWFEGVVNQKGSPFPIPFPRDWRGLVRRGGSRGGGPGGSHRSRRSKIAFFRVSKFAQKTATSKNDFFEAFYGFLETPTLIRDRFGTQNGSLGFTFWCFGGVKKWLEFWSHSSTFFKKKTQRHEK